jgi:transcriptional regulator with XRE-family HTH domain
VVEPNGGEVAGRLVERPAERIEVVAAATGAPSTAGALLRKWRQRRRLTQLAVAARSAVSARHLSFIENGRSRPSREMVLHLAQRLDIPLRDRKRSLDRDQQGVHRPARAARARRRPA